MLIENIARLRQALLPQSVGRLFVLVLAAGIGLGWVVRSVRSRCDALATIRSAGGSIRYDSNWVNKASAPGAPDHSQAPLYRSAPRLLCRFERTGASFAEAVDFDLADIVPGRAMPCPRISRARLS
jgi:hypothetical protein